jgi:lysophospholipase L1-like esterase
MRHLLAIAIPWALPAISLAGPNLGAVMFLGDSITLGADGSNSGYRGYLVEALLGNGATFSTVGTSMQGTSPYLGNLTTPGSYNPYIQHEGHPGATIQDLYVGSNPDNSSAGYVVTALQKAQPDYVFLMIGSNNTMDTAGTLATNLKDELALISYIRNSDTRLQRVFVEPPPSYPSDGGAPNGYDRYSQSLEAALSAAPYASYATFIDSRAKLTSSDFTIDAGQTGLLHPNDAGYQIIATDLYNATAAVPEPAGFALLGLAGLMLTQHRRSRL